MTDRFAWLFPGQGSQAVGMGKELAEAYPVAREVFDIADSALDFSVSTLCFDGPEEALTRTSYQQPAIVAASIATQRVLALQEKLPTPDFVAGHSLGEYSALVAAGALDLADALRLVRRRGELMEEHGLGGMIAVLGLDEDAVQLVAGEAGAEVANFNSPGQVTISGTDEALTVAEIAATTRGARRVVRLPVNGAFHSSMMQPVAEALAPDIERTPFAEPIAPLVGNVAAEPLTHPDDLRRELIEHITRPVQWISIVEALVAGGVTSAAEIGPGNVLAGLGRRIDRSLKIQTTEQLLADDGGES